MSFTWDQTSAYNWTKTSVTDQRLARRPECETPWTAMLHQQRSYNGRARGLHAQHRHPYHGHVPKEWQFTQSSNDAAFVPPPQTALQRPAASLTVIGMIEANARRGRAAATPMGQLTARRQPMPATFMRLDKRAIVIDVAEHIVTVVTHEGNGSQITDMVRADCLSPKSTPLSPFVVLPASPETCHPFGTHGWQSWGR